MQPEPEEPKKSDPSADPKKDSAPVEKEVSELEKFWLTVRENPSDFTGWTYLLQYVEQENNLPAAREAFDAFLDNYPYCYGYWKKYADMEKKLNTSEKAEEVFERGLKAIPLSVDLWTHFINFYKGFHKEDANHYAKVKAVFERSIVAAGQEFRSDRLWDLYIAWETENTKLREVTAIFDRVLATPTQMYMHHFEKFQEHINQNAPKDVLSTEEFIDLRTEFLDSKVKPDPVTDGSAAPPPPPPPPEEEEEIVEGGVEALPPGVDADDVPKIENPEIEKPLAISEENVYIKRKAIAKRQEIFKLNEEEVGKRWNFEEGIKRPYFHVKPLERAQLRNWREYLDFEIAHSNHDKIVILFERCMIACALYEDMWMKYAQYMEKVSAEAAREIFKRSCLVHLRRKPTVVLAWVAYEERQGRYDAATEALNMIEKNLPDFLEITLRRINLERRRGRNDAVISAYREAIAKARTAPMVSHFSVKLARFLYKVQKDFDKAKLVLKGAIERDPTNAHLHMQLVDVAFQRPEIDEQGLIDAFDGALNSDLNEDEKIIFAQRKLEFLEDFGMDPVKIQAAFDQYYKYSKSLGNTTKKRQTDNSESSAHKKSKGDLNGSSDDAAANQDPNMAYNYAQQWANYNPQAVGSEMDVNTANYNYQQQQAWSNYQASYYPAAQQ